MPLTIDQRERAEVERSAAEAAHADAFALVADEREVGRYLNPPADTPYPLEYCFHLLGDVRGRDVLEYGCGDGINTILLLRRGARVVALDISPELIEVARRRMEANGVTSGVEFVVASAHAVPLRDESVDVVFGKSILHHLELGPAAREVRRVLRKGGRAVFLEPVRNSKALRAARRLIPYRAPYISPFERPLTDRELEDFAEGYSSYRSKAFLLPTTGLFKLLPPLRPHLKTFYRWDAAVLKKFPALAYYASVRVVEMIK